MTSRTSANCSRAGSGKYLGKDFPDDPNAQLWGGIDAVFASWNGKRAISYRRIEGIPDEWGTAVNVQTMVFGNMGEKSATGVAFTRNPGNGENLLLRRILSQRTGRGRRRGYQDAGTGQRGFKERTQQGTGILRKGNAETLQGTIRHAETLEKHYRDMLDIEFTIENGRFWMLQCRVGKRNGPAAVRMAVDMVKEKLIKKEEAVMRVTPDQLDELLHPIIDPKAEKASKPMAKGLPAGPGGAVGQIVFSAQTAVDWKKSGKTFFLSVKKQTRKTSKVCEPHRAF